MSKDKTMNKVLGFIMAFFILLPALGFTILPAQAALDLGVNHAANIGLNNTTPQNLVVNIIKVILTFLALIAVVLILYAGFLWMTAAGNDDKVAQAKSIITNAVIGLVLILAAWGITNWVIDTVQNNIVN